MTKIKGIIEIMRAKKTIKKQAFTLIEILIVIGILGILAVFVLPELTGKGEEAKKNIVCIQMKSVGQSLKMYKINNSTYPSTSEGLKAIKFDEGKMPKDSWSNEFIYTSDGKTFEIISFGPNKKEGGGDDIYYTKCGEK
jgi:general secretion pathway protein G